MLFAFLNVRSTSETTFNLSRAFLVGQLLVQRSIKHVVPCAWVHWTHTKRHQAILTCFFLIFLQRPQFHFFYFYLHMRALFLRHQSLRRRMKGTWRIIVKKLRFLCLLVQRCFGVVLVVVVHSMRYHCSRWHDSVNNFFAMGFDYRGRCIPLANCIRDCTRNLARAAA